MKIRKAQNGDILLFGNPNKDEILTYRTKDGKIITKTNNISVSGTDPIGKLLVEGAVLNKPTSTLIKYIGNKTLPLIKKIKSAISSNNTDKLIRALGDKYKGPAQNDLITPENNALADYLAKNGVDISKFSNSDLTRLSNARRKTILETRPEGRNATVSIEKIKNNYRNDIRLNRGEEEIGYLGTYAKNGKSHISEVESYAPGVEKHVSEDLYNAGIKTAKSQNTSGLISGEYLNSPEQTYKIWEKFTKVPVSNKGTHNFNHGDYIKKVGEEYTITDGRVVELTSPTKNLPTKSFNIFHPNTVTKTGKFTTNWADPDIYKLLPLGLFYEKGNN